jgi:hypothetical protein
MRRIFLLLLAALFLFSFSSTTPAVKSDIVMVSKNSALKGGLTRSNFQDSIRSLYNHLQLEKAGLAFEVFNLGMVGYHNLKYQGKLGDKNLLTIIDFTKPSTKKRFYTIDLDHGSLKYHTYVAHGRNTGENEARKFSNIPHSNQSSLGFYVTGETYVGSKGYSLRLDGTESKYNGNLRSRAVVVHDAEYVSESWIKRYGRLGRSQGCPALPKELAKPIINTIKNKTAVFAYYNDEQYVKSSEYLSVESLMKKLEIQESLTQQPAVAAE